MSPGGIVVDFITCYQQIIFIFQPWLVTIKRFLNVLNLALVCSDKKFLHLKVVKADVYEPSLDYWKCLVAKSFRGENNQPALVKENDRQYENTDCVPNTSSARTQNRQIALLMPLLILLHISICTSSSISCWIIFDIAASFIKPLRWHLVQIKLHYNAMSVHIFTMGSHSGIQTPDPGSVPLPLSNKGSCRTYTFHRWRTRKQLPRAFQRRSAA